ncbi:MAG: MFS transporter [Candidatus Roizmanbacteria bacterium]
MKKWKLDILSILLVAFSGSLGFSLVLLSLIVLTTKFGGNSVVYGFLASIYPAFQFIGSIVLGRMSDVRGRRPILLISMVCGLGAWIFFVITFFLPVTTLVTIHSEIFGTFVVTLPLLILMISRAIEGFTAGNVSVAQAYIADITSENQRRKNYGTLSIASNLGFIIGPALAGLLSLSVVGERLPVFVAIGLAIITLYILFHHLPESLTKKQRQQSDKQKVHTLLQKVSIKFILTMFFLVYFAFNIFYTALPLYALQELNWNITKLGIYFSFVALMMALVQGPVMSYFAKRYTDSQLIKIGSGILAIGFLMFISPVEYIIIIAALFFALGNGLMWPSLISYLSKQAGEEFQGIAQGLSGSAGSLASVIGLITGGFLFDKLAGYAFIVPAFVILSVFMTSVFYLRKNL